MAYFLICMILAAGLDRIMCLFIDGCPLYGCRPSGSFSFSQNIPRSNVSVNWISKFQLDPVPLAAGCVSDSVNIVCLSNGVFSEDKGYISIYSENGTIQWRDTILTYPTMPILDNYGDVTGTDGTSLVHYDQDGKTYPIINVTGTAPVFNIQLVGQIYLLMVSENGGLFVRDTNAIPVAYITLNDTVQRMNGSFIPISQPVVNGQRFYLLTEFVPSSETRDLEILNLQRLYAIDINHRQVDIMTVAWYFNFETEKEHTMKDTSQGSGSSRPNLLDNIKDGVRNKQNLLWDDNRQTVYVALPKPYNYGVKGDQEVNTFWAFVDQGNSPSLIFRSDLDVTHMASYEPDDQIDVTQLQQLWVTNSSSKILSISAQGNVTKEIDLNVLLKTQVTITSKLSLVHDDTTSSNILVLGVKTQSQTRAFKDSNLRFIPNTAESSYVVAIDTVPQMGGLLWSVPVPENLVVKGQISGLMGGDDQQKDQLVVYADDGAKNAKIFTLH